MQMVFNYHFNDSIILSKALSLVHESKHISDTDDHILSLFQKEKSSIQDFWLSDTWHLFFRNN